MKNVIFVVVAILFLVAAFGSDMESALPPPRLANGAVIEGTIKDVSADGIAMETSKGPVSYPWRYLSAATRFRYQVNVDEPAKNKGK